MTSPDRSAPEGVDDVVRLALRVPGVHAVRVEPSADGGGASFVRLELERGADEAQVTRAVEEALRARRPPEPRRSAEELARQGAAPEATATGPTRERPGAGITVDVPLAPVAPRPASRPKTGRISVPSVTSPTVAATPAPQWLGETPTPQVEASPAPPSQPVVAPAARAQLRRVEVATEALSTRASVVLAVRGATHTGVAEGPATAAGGARSVATAALRALESAAAGALRADVEGVSLADLAGRRTALVLLDVASSRGAEQLVGAALVDRDEHHAVVRAVLDAANRRFGLDLPR